MTAKQILDLQERGYSRDQIIELDNVLNGLTDVENSAPPIVENSAPIVENPAPIVENPAPWNSLEKQIAALVQAVQASNGRVIDIGNPNPESESAEQVLARVINPYTKKEV